MFCTSFCVLLSFHKIFNQILHLFVFNYNANTVIVDLHGLKTFAKITKNIICKVTPSNVQCTPCSLFCIHRFEPWRAPFVNNGPVTDRAVVTNLRQARPPHLPQCRCCRHLILCKNPGKTAFFLVLPIQSYGSPDTHGISIFITPCLTLKANIINGLNPLNC